MSNLSTAIERFIFRGFNFFGEAKRFEYWLILPLVWLAILVLAWFDIRQVYAMLLAREIPSLNPLNYSAPLLWMVTLIPRYAVTVRRLNDAGRSPKWALLPLKATVASVVITIGLASVLLTSGGGAAEGAVGLIVVFSLFGGGFDWETAFAAAQIFSVMDFGVFFQALSFLDLGQLSQTAAANVGADPARAGGALAVLTLIVLSPVMFMVIFLIMMMAPSRAEPFGARYDFSSVNDTKEKRSNAFAGYATLARFEDEKRDPALAAARRAQGKDEVRSLYRSRVLGEPET